MGEWINDDMVVGEVEFALTILELTLVFVYSLCLHGRDKNVVVSVWRQRKLYLETLEHLHDEQ